MFGFYISICCGLQTKWSHQANQLTGKATLRLVASSADAIVTTHRVRNIVYILHVALNGGGGSEARVDVDSRFRSSEFNCPLIDGTGVASGEVPLLGIANGLFFLLLLFYILVYLWVRKIKRAQRQVR